MKLIIAGSRDFSDYNFLKHECENFITEYIKRDYHFLVDRSEGSTSLKGIWLEEHIEIVCGMARGADLLGKKFAEENEYNVAEFPANWALDGKSAGYKRNKKMAKYATHCIVFRIGGPKSKGSTHMINLAKEYGLVLRVVDL